MNVEQIWITSTEVDATMVQTEIKKMDINFSYTGQLANLAGISEETVSPDAGTDLGTVVGKIASNHGDAFSELILDDDGKLRRTLLVIVDGEQLDGDRESFLLDGAKNIVLMTPIAGG